MGKTVPDLIAPGLKILFTGINPSLYSAAVGQHFARPGNRFWPTLHNSGFTPRLFSPFEGRLLVDLGYGITNLVERATNTAAELSVEEFLAGGKRLEVKIGRYSPTIVAFLGITAYRAAFGRPDAIVGLQRDKIGQAKLWVLPNPSGLNAHYQRDDLKQLFEKLREASEAGAIDA
jgi:TDG/mug DNA glycosylase family protein